MYQWWEKVAQRSWAFSLLTASLLPVQPWGSWKSCLEHRAEELILAWVRVLDSLLAVEAWGPVLLPSPLWMLVVPVAQHTAHVGLSRISVMSET